MNLLTTNCPVVLSLFGHSESSGCFGSQQWPQIRGREELFRSLIPPQHSHLVMCQEGSKAQSQWTTGFMGAGPVCLGTSSSSFPRNSKKSFAPKSYSSYSTFRQHSGDLPICSLSLSIFFISVSLSLSLSLCQGPVQRRRHELTS